MDNQRKAQVIIAGAGLTGLVTAFYLKKAGVDFVLIEKSGRTGGVIRTYKDNGFVYESGPNTAVLSQPEVAELFEDLGTACELETAKEEAKRRLIWKNGRWHALPSGLMQGISTPLFSFKDKLRILGEPFRPKGTNPDENLASLVRRRLGESFLNYAVDPFILGIYAGDPEYLVPRYALPKLYNLEQNYGSFIGGAIKKSKEPKTERDKKATKQVFSVKGGLENLIKALTNAIGEENIVLNAEKLQFQKQGNDFLATYSINGLTEHIITENVVSTATSPEVPGLFPFLSNAIANSIDNLQYSKVAELAIGFKEWKGMPLNAFGGLVPFKENKNILGALFLSSFLEGRAPEGGAIITIFTGGFRKPELMELPDDEMIRIVGNDVKEMLGLQQFNPDLLKIFRYSYAIPQYGINSGERFNAVESAQKEHPGLYIAGNLRDGIGMADRIKQATAIAREIGG